MIEEFHKQPTLPGFFLKETGAPLPEIPAVIGPYKIESLLEKGGMSILYLASHPETHEPITIKVLSPKYISHPEMLQRFKTEAEIISMTNHPNIVQMYGFGEWEGGLYIAMEFVQGISLRQYILQTPVSLVRALDIVIDIAYALCHLHSHGVIHRDLKPENILINEAGEVKVIDFGIAQLLTGVETQLQGKSPHLIGTPIYMSPEQRENPETVSYPSDIYSLGIVAYELILGRLSHGQIHIALMPSGIQKILHKALQPNPENRFQDVVDVIAAISAYKTSNLIQREKKVGDSISELAESMRRAQTALVQTTPPSWPDFEIGLALHQGLNLSGIYYDFLTPSEGEYAIIMGEAVTLGAEGLISTAILRGLVQSLSRIFREPEELMAHLNEAIFNDSKNQSFRLNYLLLCPKKNTFTYISCNYGDLWKMKPGEAPTVITNNNSLLGASSDTKFTAVHGSLELNETLILNTFATAPADSGGFSETIFEQTLVENVDRTPQKLVESILRKARVNAGKAFLERSLSVISILRKS